MTTTAAAAGDATAAAAALAAAAVASASSSTAAVHATIRVIEREEEATGNSKSQTAGAAPRLLPKELSCRLPPGIAIQRNAYGHGLFATQPFATGEMLYLTACLYVPDIPGTVPLRIEGTGQAFTLDMVEHSVAQSDKPGCRQLYTFDAFMNHGCDPNTGSVVTGVDEAQLAYGVRALRPIAAGEELTCDYTLFEYDAGPAAIQACQCGAAQCLGQILGFKHLSLEQAAPRFATAEPYVIASYLQHDRPNTAFVDARGQQPQNAVDWRARASVRATEACAAGAVLAEGVAVQCFGGAGPRQLVLAVGGGEGASLPESWVVPSVPQAGAGSDDDGLWPLRALLPLAQKGGSANVRAERVEAEAEGRVTYRLVATREIGAGDALSLA